MSYNVMAAVAHEDTHEVRPMILYRVGAGITHSASISVGEVITFQGIRMKVNSIVHAYQPPGSRIAPISTAYCEPEQPLNDSEIKVLKDLGFEDA